MKRWMKAICLIAAINEFAGLPPYTPGDMANNVTRLVFFAIACLFAYGAVTERSQP